MCRAEARCVASGLHVCVQTAHYAKQFDDTLTSVGGLETLIAACEEHLTKRPDDWRQFLEPHFREQRSWLFCLVEALPLAAVGPAYGIVDALVDLKANREGPADLLKAQFDDRYLASPCN